MMATELPMPESTDAAWNECIDQELLTLSQRQVTCGRSTHVGPVCGWCGAKV